MFFFIVYQFIIFSHNHFSFKNCLILQHLKEIFCFLRLPVYESFKQLYTGHNFNR